MTGLNALPARTSLSSWWAGARPRTLAIGVMPVLVGAAASGHPTVPRTVAALIVALGLQVGANYANDYFDGVRGVDTEQRVGPMRLVASGTASPRAVLSAAAASLSVAGVVGVALCIATGQLQLLGLGALAVLAAVLYTGGPRPYAGIGVADIAVFLFFGLLAVTGTVAVEIGHTTKAGWWAAVPVGLLAVGVLVANNLRDVRTDAEAGRKTLIVRIGLDRGRRLYQGVVGAPFIVTTIGVIAGGLPAATLITLIVLPLVVRPIALAGHGEGRQLVPVLIATAKLHLAFSLALTVGLVAAGLTGRL